MCEEKRPIHMSLSCIDIDSREIGYTEHVLFDTYMNTWYACENRPIFFFFNLWKKNYTYVSRIH